MRHFAAAAATSATLVLNVHKLLMECTWKQQGERENYLWKREKKEGKRELPGNEVEEKVGGRQEAPAQVSLMRFK